MTSNTSKVRGFADCVPLGPFFYHPMRMSNNHNLMLSRTKSCWMRCLCKNLQRLSLKPKTVSADCLSLRTVSLTTTPPFCLSSRTTSSGGRSTGISGPRGRSRGWMKRSIGCLRKSLPLKICSRST